MAGARCAITVTHGSPIGSVARSMRDQAAASSPISRIFFLADDNAEGILKKGHTGKWDAYAILGLIMLDAREPTMKRITDMIAASGAKLAEMKKHYNAVKALNGKVAPKMTVIVK